MELLVPSHRNADLMLLFAYRTRIGGSTSAAITIDDVMRARREAVERTNEQPSYADGIGRQSVRERSRRRQSSHLHKSRGRTPHQHPNRRGADKAHSV